MKSSGLVEHCLSLTVMTILAASCASDRGGIDDGGGPAVTEGVSRELARHRNATLSDVRYGIRLSIPGSRSDDLEGEITIHLTRNDPSAGPLVIDFARPEDRVRALRVDGEPVAPEFRFDHVVVPGEHVPGEGPVEVAVEFRTGDEGLDRSDDYLYALFVPDRAHSTLPLFDQPDLKARFTLELEGPAEWAMTSNGPVVTDEIVISDGLPSEERREEGLVEERRRVVFGETEPLSTYLFTFAAGRFDVIEGSVAGRPASFHHRETDSARVERNREAVLSLHGRALEWLEDYTGIPYPFQRFGWVAIPAFQYNGMEHPGAVFYRASSLFLDESATQSDFLGRASVIAHETAHMWFGDLVTMEWFDDVWMKEVLANFMAAKIVEPSFPELNHELRFYLAHYPSAYSVDRTGGSHPVRQELENLNEAGSLYGPIIYQKAPIAMRQLELLVGEGTFREGMREYLRRHAYGNASWLDLVGILDELSAEDVSGWSRVWIEESGRPTLTARATDDGEGRILRLVVEQEDPEGLGRTWPQSLHVVLGFEGDSTVALPVRLDAASVEVPGAAGMSVPRWIVPGGRGLGYGYVRLDADSRESLVDGLPEIESDLIRGVAWTVLWEDMLEGGLDPEAFFALLLDGAEREPEEQNLQRVLGYLDTTWWRILGEERREALAERAEAALWRGVTGDRSTSVRAAYLRAFRSVVTTRDGIRTLRSLLEEGGEPPGLPLSENDRTAIVSELALRGEDDAEELLDRRLETIDNPDRRERLRFIRPSLSGDPAVREAFFRELAAPENREREPWVTAAVANLHHPLRANQGLRFVEPSLEMLEEVRRTGDIFFPTSWLDATLWGHTSPEAAETVRRFLADRPAYPVRLRQKILQSADLLLRVADMRRPGENQ